MEAVNKMEVAGHMETNEAPQGLLCQVLKMYKDLHFLQNPTCEVCKPKHKNPLSLWQVGNKFAEDEHKILFVGKTARGDWGEPESNGYSQKPLRVAGKRFLKGGSPYWRYTCEIVSKLYGSPEEGWDRIAFTNIIKCPDTKTVDKTEDSVKENCICKLAVIQKEIEILEPKNVIFYTGNKYDRYIDNLINELKVYFKAERIDIKERDVFLSTRIGPRPRGSNRNSRQKKANDLKYCRKELIGSNGDKIMRFLITSHPERQPKARFVDKLVAWILQKDTEP